MRFDSYKLKEKLGKAWLSKPNLIHEMMESSIVTLLTHIGLHACGYLAQTDGYRSKRLNNKEKGLGPSQIKTMEKE